MDPMPRESKRGYGLHPFQLPRNGPYSRRDQIGNGGNPWDGSHCRGGFRIGGLLNAGTNVLTTEIVEGDDIHLEHTRAKVVRGNRVTLGPGCEVDLVEYKEHFHQDKSAKVMASRKV